MSASGNCPRRDDQCDLLGQEAPSYERKGARRGTIEPLRVVDDTEQRSLLGDLRQQAEDRQSDEKGVRGRPVLSPKATASASRSRIRQTLEVREARRAQLL